MSEICKSFRSLVDPVITELFVSEQTVTPLVPMLPVTRTVTPLLVLLLMLRILMLLLL